MTARVEVNCSTGDATTVPLTAAEITQQQQDATAWDAVAAQQATLTSNGTTLRQRAINALTANANYQSIASPTNAQVVAQVALLTKECNGIIRLLLSQLDSTSGT